MTTAHRDPTGEAPDAAVLRATERERLRALVTGDLDRAARLHAGDFQLINPLAERSRRTSTWAASVRGRSAISLGSPVRSRSASMAASP